ncbi:PKD domain-containing protein [Methanobacterium ferruginis]|uniref:PKD domain-containing protein n=1 Tax=Methanobacterium ferruginis TaxID=710191 RepID=UPI002573CA6A|nr:PKD domain-containing protein [Methanobacterium ferruginis]BDZ68612.1 hypothetical protein GCM10025860_20600 [Methanobacterium ferruginis]
MVGAFQRSAFQENAFQSSPPPLPVADFTQDVISGAPPLVVQFTDTSDNYPTKWFWEYKRDNGEWKKLSELRNPDISFNIPGNYSIRLTVSNETGSDTETKNDLITVSSTPYEPYNILKDSKISKRLNDGLTEIQTNLSVAIPAHAFHSGQEFEYTIYDTSQKDFTVVKGIIEDVERDYIDASRIYSLSGRDNGRLLIKQPYGISCAEDDGNTYLFGDVLESILTDTGVTVGRGQEELRTDRHVTNNNVDDGTRYCGSWSTKKDALDDLFENYRKQAGLNKIRWFIDFAGYLRWFEINSERMGVIYF